MKMKKSIALLISLILVLTVTVGGTLAFLIATSDTVKNTFTPSSVTTEVYEEFENNLKKNVSIKNTGDTAAYIRAAVVVTWQKYNEETGKYDVYGTVPVKGTDYEISYNLGDQANHEGKWILGSDGFYYWPSFVEPGETTGVLIKRAAASTPAPAEGYTLCIEILGSGIQAEGVDEAGKSPIELAWGSVAAGFVKEG